MGDLRYIARHALAVLVLCGIIGVGWAGEGKKAEGKEGKISRENVPAAVMSAFKLAYPKAEIIGTSQETEDSTSYFEIESRDGKVTRDVLYKADGTVKEMEEQVTKAELPAAIKDAIANEYPKGKIKKSEKAMREGTITYELIVKNRQDEMEVVLDETGKILKTEKTTNEEKDQD